MGPVQTLHDFALNLLNDPQSAAAYQADPQGVLNSAGLAGVSPADVQDIMPLVTDLAPAAGSAPFAAGDVSGVLDQVGDAAPRMQELAQEAGSAAGPLDLSGVFGAVSHLTEETGLNTLTHGVLDEVSHLVDGVAAATSGVPIVGPLLDAGAVDLQNTVSAVGDHLFDGKLVGSAVDAVTNHLGDAALWKAAVHESGQLPLVGGLAGPLVEGVRETGSGLLGSVNSAVGSTPVGVHTYDPARADLPQTGDLPGGVSQTVSNAVGNLPDAVLQSTGELPGTLTHAAGVAPAADGTVPVGNLAGTLSGSLTDATTDTAPRGDLSSAGDLTGTLDHAVPAADAASAVPALPAAPAVPALPATSSLPDAGSLTHTIEGATAQAPVVSQATEHVLAAAHDTTETVTSHSFGDYLGDAHTAGILHSDVQTVVTDETDLIQTLGTHTADSSVDGLHLGH
ncbi:IniB N-terminal domain-containing protein [Amycolatopsis panacis]|uniref:Uncharacterized protein n=1 Tax=Amycolatopsis panacis TaxID=2340917 RepID=A0A419I7Z6_9PSEU|nr:IniB N-terminal domain-containing protein [Amycolatopsis panacis]RJQ88192.1 hypothetical protein D5S19_07725 [Amycolatopsis panacis]